MIKVALFGVQFCMTLVTGAFFRDMFKEDFYYPLSRDPIYQISISVMVVLFYLMLTYIMWRTLDE